MTLIHVCLLVIGRVVLARYHCDFGYYPQQWSVPDEFRQLAVGLPSEADYASRLSFSPLPTQDVEDYNTRKFYPVLGVAWF